MILVPCMYVDLFVTLSGGVKHGIFGENAPNARPPTLERQVETSTQD